MAAPSTAAGVAWLRAAHQLLDSAPRILNDPVVLRLLPERVIEALRADASPAQSDGARALRSHVVLRSRFAEDRLQLAMQRGVRQYLILGAGYDTFIARQPEWARALRIVEVDRPAIQAQKRERLAEIGVAVPENVRFVSIDFEAETLVEGLARQGVSLEEPTFFSWLGVTMYLTEPAIDAVLLTVASAPAGSEIVFTFAPLRDRAADGLDMPTLADRAASIGEPWISYFTTESLERKLDGLGFSRIEFLSPAQAEERYFASRADALPAPRRTTIVSAIV